MFLREWEAWRAERLARLSAERGWLAVVDLRFLEPGPNRVPGLPGTFTLRDGRVELEAAAGDGWTNGGRPVIRRELVSDADPAPDVLALGAGRAVQVLARGDRRALRVWDADAPARRAFGGVPTFPPDPAWRIEARWEPYDPPRTAVVVNVLGDEATARVPGRATFEVGERTVSLEPTANPGGGLFFVFRDATSGKETYGAGRFLSAEAPQDGKVVLDFNRAVSPPCAFTAFATCPLPRPENVLPVRIPAGERLGP
jgi:uncharacterized protein (DUF1684 family)